MRPNIVLDDGVAAAPPPSRPDRLVLTAYVEFNFSGTARANAGPRGR